MKTRSVLKSITVLVLLLYASSFKSATCVSTGNGAWNNPASWSCGTVPGCGDSIVILAGHAVTVTAQADYSACGTAPVVAVYGKLYFDNGNKLRLPCNGRIYIFSSGAILPGTGGGNSNFIEICGDVLWNSAAGPLYGSGCLPPNWPPCAGVLPIELIEFNAQINNNKLVDVLWSTASEKNNNYFEIQKSLNAIEFEKTGTVASKANGGNSNSYLSYIFEDTNPLFGVSYYRLKQVDYDNSFSYSKVVSVNYVKEKNIRFVIYPNPNNGEFTADISGIENNHEVTINLYNEKGKLVYESIFFINDSTNSKFKIIPSEKLVSGIYFCTLTIEGIEYKVKVVVS